MEDDTFWSSAEWDWNVDESDSVDSDVKPKVLETCEISMEDQECTLAKIVAKQTNLGGFIHRNKEEATRKHGGTERDPMPSSQNWCEISLDGDDGEGVEMNDLHASGEPALQQPVAKDVEKETSSSSFAYQLGMMVVSKAAEVVHTVAESGDKGEKENGKMEKMQEKLERATSRGEELFLELENAKQWVSYHESMEQNLNQQLNDATERFVSTQKEAELKLQASRSDTERLDIELHAEKLANNELRTKQEMNQRTIEDLEKQVILLSNQLKQRENAHDIPAKSKSHAMQGCQTDAIHIAENSVQCALDGNDDKRLEDTTTALATANSRCEKMRHRLKTSLESMKAQTSQMRTSRVALEDALNESRDTRQKLCDERLKAQNAENELKQVRETEIVLRKELGDAIEATRTQNEEIQQLHKNLEVARSQDHEYTRKITAQSLVQNCIRNASQEIENLRYEEKIKEATSRCEDLAKEVEEQKTSKICLQSSLYEAQAKEHETSEKLRLAKVEITTLSEAHEKTKEEARRGADEVQHLKITLEQRDQILEDTRSNFKKLLHVKNQEADGLNRVIKNLESENSSLRRKIEEEINKRNASCAENERRCSSLQSQISDIAQSLRSAEAENKDLNVQISEKSAENADLLSHRDLAKKLEKHLKQAQEELSSAEATKSEMLAVTEEDRRTITAYGHAVHNLREDCRGLDWICRDQHRRIVELSRQNHSMRLQLGDLAGSDNSAMTRTVDKTPAVLDTIIETEERDSVSKTPSSDRVLSVANSVSEADEVVDLASTSQTSLDASVAIRATSPTSSTASTTKRKKSRKITTKKRANLPVRQRSRSNSNSTLHSEHIPSLSSVTVENYDDCVFSPSQEPQRRLGIPMPEEQFNEIAGNHLTASVPAHKDFDHVNLSHDDGYASSTCVTPHRRSRRSNRNRPAPGTSTEHYYVTYDGATFDLATFSLAKMRQLTSTCPSTHTPDGMDAFFEFLADKANELNSDPRWRGRHTLGEAADWLQLRGVYN